MPQVSKRFLNQKTQDRIFSLFISGIVTCSSKDSAISLVEDLLTPTEKIMLAKRFSIAYMLLVGYDYDSIISILKVSRTTVGHVSLWLKVKGNGFREVISKIKSNESTRKIFEEIQDAFEEMLANVRGQNWNRSKSWLRQRRKEREKSY